MANRWRIFIKAWISGRISDRVCRIEIALQLNRFSITAAQWSLSALCLVPLGQLLWRTLNADLGPDPGRELALATGLWGLRLLLATLIVTPLRLLTGQPLLIRFRRTLGLFAMLYFSLHFLCWLLFLLQLRMTHVVSEIVERPYITVGFTAFLMLVPLAVTSTRSMRRRLGRNWRRLHFLIYPVATLGCLHFLWLSKDYSRPLFYSTVLAVLLGFRLVSWWHRQHLASGSPSAVK